MMMMMMMFQSKSIFLVSLAIAIASASVVDAFVVVPSSSQTTATTATATPTTTTLFAEEKDFLDTIQSSFKIAQESNAAGSSFKQVVADVLAGDDYDKDAISKSIEETIASAPCGKHYSILFCTILRWTLL